MTRGERALPRHVLLIEDDPDTAVVARGFLTQAGMSMTHAPTLRDGVAHLKQQSFDAVVLDLGLPDVTQAQAMAGVSIRAVWEAGNGLVPLIVMTGWEVNGLATRATQTSRVQLWLQKGEPHAIRGLPMAVTYAVGFIEGAQAMWRTQEELIFDPDDGDAVTISGEVIIAGGPRAS